MISARSDFSRIVVINLILRNARFNFRHIRTAEPRQSCEPLSVLICTQHYIWVLANFFEIALLKFFKPHHLIEGVL